MSYKETIPSLIQKMKAATSLQALSVLKAASPFDTYQKKEKLYPPLPFQISPEEIQGLKDKGWMNDSKDGDINNQLIVPKFKDASTLEKLLLSIIWKNGDLLKIARIVDGIESKELTAKSYVTFHQFGHYLNDTKNGIIVDQHVLRAYRVIDAMVIGKEILDKVLSKKTLKGKKDYQLIEDYKKWISDNGLIQASIKQEPDYFQVMDDLLFAVGKYLKR